MRHVENGSGLFMHAGLRIDEAIVRQWFFLIRCESEDNLSYRLTLTGSRTPSQFGYAASNSGWTSVRSSPQHIANH